jgi:NucS shadow ORF
MSLTVPADVLERAQQGNVGDTDFITCIRASLPYAWSVITALITTAAQSGAPFADNHTPPPDEQARGELLRMMASDAMRGAVERHFGVRVAFQNCHRAAIFTQHASEDLYNEFVSPRAQLMNQSPELVNC